ncbi:MAG: polyprenyl synthetase family protein [Candidatus Omnitrophica bacterium]|nr:polyprenyl synthetase family protein [Candidatus Omnitrophota bacterium]
MSRRTPPLSAYFKKRQALVNRALERVLPKADAYPNVIHEAMRYGVLGEGKRVRPILALAACEAVGGALEEALPAGCAIELVHAYSLVHDDLPAMDDDDFRRGRPSCHKQFGEAIGILAGDALFTLSFQVISRQRSHPARWLQINQELAQAAGTFGMIGGQVADLQGPEAAAKTSTLEYILEHKTGALIAAAVRMGALAGGATPKQLAKLTRYGECVGLVFQLVDDLLDRDGVVKVWGELVTRQRAENLTAQAKAALASFGSKAQPLRDIADFLNSREH